MAYPSSVIAIHTSVTKRQSPVLAALHNMTSAKSTKQDFYSMVVYKGTRT